MSEELKPCPFCGGAPFFEGNVNDWHDDNRYVELSLTCCSTMTETIGWRKAQEMTENERTTELRERLTRNWNVRITEHDIDQLRGELAAVTKERDEHKARADKLQAALDGLHGFEPVYAVPFDDQDGQGRQLYTITNSPIPMADNWTLYRREVK